MKKFLGALGIALLSSWALAADQTMTGTISDSMCGRSHKAMTEHGTSKMTDADCTKACVKNGGKYVFVSGSKIYEIDNQDYAGLSEHAGHTVKLTGSVNGDTVHVASIEMPSKS